MNIKYASIYYYIYIFNINIRFDKNNRYNVLFYINL